MKYLWNDASCQMSDCPALLETDDAYFVVGKIPTAQERADAETAAAEAGKGIGADEILTRVPKNVLDRLRKTA